MRFRVILVLAVCLAFGGALWIPSRLDEVTLAADPPPAAAWMGPLAGLTLRAQLAVTREPWSFHLVNLLAHAAAVWVASQVLEQWLGGRAGWIAAGVFAIHPLQTEVMADVFARGAALSGLLALAAVRAWQAGRQWRACGWFAAALAAGPAAVGLPMVLALSEWGGERRREARRPLMAMLGAAVLAVILWGGIGDAQRLSTQGVAMLRSLWLLLAPIGLTPEPAVKTQPWLASLAWGAIASVLVLAVSIAKGRRPGFWVVAGFMLLLPSAAIPPSGPGAADSRMYLAMVFFGAAFGVLLRRVDVRLLGAMGLIWMGASLLQTRLWQNPRALWMEAARLAPESVRAKRELATLLPPGQAMEMLAEAAESAPDNACLRSAMGLVRLRAGDVGGAEAEFEKALELDPCLFEAVWNLERLRKRERSGMACTFTPEQRKLLGR
ncbi:MAG: hypothetical protein HXY18_15950 [Bryobacteraceae bacterium]|nr:hypothetical protein [Bryobacteraceae bacterium]